MSTDPPIVCSLTAAELPARLAEIRAVGEHALLSSRQTTDGAVLRLRPGAGTRTRVEALLQAEEECCPFLAFELSEREDAIVLTIRSPEDGRAVVQDLVATFEGA